MNKTLVASLLRRGELKRAERTAVRIRMEANEFAEFVKRFFNPAGDQKVFLITYGGKLLGVFG